MGSSRVIAQSNGTLCYDADFTPYGGERSYTSTCAQNYKFEGKERDTETQNDDFGAREYSWRFGRWLSADWSSVPVPVPYANLSNPQTLNLYAMVADDPESFADLDGHDTCNGPNNNCFPPNTHTVFDNINRIATPPQELAASQKTAAQNASQVAQNRTPGRQPDGSYWHPTGPGSEIAKITDNTSPLPPLIGNGECVTATAAFSGVTTTTSKWSKGEPVIVNGEVNPNLKGKEGTAVATFDSNGRYFPTSAEKNSGIYMRPSTKGSFNLLEQWPKRTDSQGNVIRDANPPHIRTISPNGSYPSDNSAAYYVIIVPR